MNEYEQAELVRGYEGRIARFEAASKIAKKKVESQRRKLSGLQKKIKAQNKQLHKLRGIIQALVREASDDGVEDHDGEGGEEDIEMREYVENEDDQDNEGDEDSSRTKPSDDSNGSDSDASGSSKDYPLSIFDASDGIPRCSICAWEVIDGLCQSCWKKHVVSPDSTEEDHALRSVSTDYHVIPSARRPAPRGSTPLLDIFETHLGHVPTYIWSGESDYRTLLKRGATRQMCEAFLLEFTDEQGIVAWANEYIIEEFAGPAMKEIEKWKIYLGRSLVLDPADTDGSAFIEELLEEVALFQPHSEEATHPEFMYETILESPGIWATRPKEPRAHELDEDKSEEDEDEERAYEDLDQKADREIDCATNGVALELALVKNEYEYTDEDLEMMTETETETEDDGDQDEEDELSDDDDPSVFTHPARTDRDFDIEQDGVYDSNGERSSSADSDFDEDE